MVLLPAVAKRVLREVAQMVEQPLEGIRVLVPDDVRSITAVVDGPEGTPYEGGSFRLRMVLGDDFPRLPPKGFFTTKIFHPNVNPGDVRAGAGEGGRCWC